MNINYKSLILVISLLFALSASISAAPGDLDPTFGNGGIVITTPLANTNISDAQGMALQADGKIVVVGDSYHFAVARYNPNGSLDTSFGGSGVVVTPLSGSAYSVAIQADGKIVVAGGGGGGSVVVRYNPNGSLDTTFNGTGIVITQINGYTRSVAIQSDGKIVVTGDGSSGGSITLVRYNTNGSLDTSFDNDGIVTTQVGSAFSGAYAVAIQADGKIVAAGFSSGGLTLVRYNPNGSLDTTFNGTGIVITPGSTYSVAIQADGKILTAGGNGLLRYNANGTPDTSFGGTGGVAVGIGVSSVAIQADGKIVAAGGTGGAFAVTRLHGNGSPDTSFGGTGTVITPIDTQGNYYGGAAAVAIQPDGKIVAAGVAIEPVHESLAVALVRYQGDSATPTSCPNPIDCADFFVRQHYRDFLLREPDTGGFSDWVNVLNNCSPGQGGLGSPPDCDRVHVSSGFFRSTEFGERGYWIYRFYHGALGRRPQFAEFTPDMRRLSGFMSPAEQEAARAAFVADFMGRPEFTAIYGGLTNAGNAAQFIAKLEEKAQVMLPATVPPTQPGQPPQYGRAELIQKMSSGEFTAAQTLRAFIEQKVVFDAFFYRAFVAMQYFGYLLRDPEPAGYDDWVDVLTNGRGSIPPGDFRHLIFGFIYSLEYRQRFGPP